jgi:hypothetical protein
LTPTARSLALLRRSGYTADIVERWLPIPDRPAEADNDRDSPCPFCGHRNHVDRQSPSRIRRDLFSCIDIVAVRTGIAGVLGVQATSASNVAARVNKARKLAALAVWLRAGNAFQVWGWSQGDDGRWCVRRVAIRAEDLNPEELERPARRRRKRPAPCLFAHF